MARQRLVPLVLPVQEPVLQEPRPCRQPVPLERLVLPQLVQLAGLVPRQAELLLEQPVLQVLQVLLERQGLQSLGA